MKILVTGGHGFIGSHLVEALIKDNHDVFVIDDHSNSESTEITINAKAKNFDINICHLEKMDEFFKENHPFDYVFHLAADLGTSTPTVAPIRTHVINSLGTCNLLQYSKISGVKRFILASTGAVYGLTNKPPYDEDMKVDNMNPHTVSKGSAEALCEMFYRLYNLPTVSLRLFNVYGDRAKDTGEFAPLVGKILRQKKEGEKYSVCGDGSRTRDFIHVDDVVRAMVMAAESDNYLIFGEVLNVGSGKEHSIMEVIDLADRREGKKYHFLPAREGESLKSCANIDKIKKMLGWEPSTSLEDYINSKNS